LLKEDLERVGVQCFFDEHSLEVGDKAAEKMLNAMEEATYGIIILSPVFFEREWCMKELQTFVRRGRVVPIFFGDYGAVTEAARTAVVKGLWKTFETFDWRKGDMESAVKFVTQTTGVRLAEDGWWHSCIRKVRDEVLRLLGKDKGVHTISEDELLVGQEAHLKELKRLLGLPHEGASSSSEALSAGSSQVVGIVGVKGMGGVGKTTLAKRLYDEPDVREWFAGAICWLEVGPSPSEDKIQYLQKQILKELGNVDENPWNPTRGRELIRQRLGSKRVLICLDDVWEIVSTATPIVIISDLGGGSRILKTSRVRAAIGGWIHDLDSLGQGPAWELFCWHAFSGDKPPNDLANSAEKAALWCGGLPLALRVLGRQVAEANDKKKCLQTFLDLPRESDAMIACRSVVRKSVENLPAEPRGLGDVFILIAGMWPRTPDFMGHQRAIENLGAAVYGDSPSRVRCTLARNALDKLNSLLLIGQKKDGDSEGFSLTVHDLIVDVAEVLAVEKEQGFQRFYCQPAGVEKLPLNVSRLEHLSLQSGRISIQGLRAALSLILGPAINVVACDTYHSEPNSCRLLVTESGHAGGFQIMTSLQCLRWSGGSFDSLPAWIEHLDDLHVLEFKYCAELRTLYNSIGLPTGLTSLSLTWCQVPQRLPKGIGRLTGLTTLSLSGCQALQRLPEEIGRLTGLTMLDLSGSQALQSLPEESGG
jgi:hypothetical protein